MKTYRNLYQKMLASYTIEDAFNEYKKGRAEKFYVKEFERDIDEGIYDIRRVMLNGYPYVEHRPKQIYDGISRKKRIIIVPSQEEQLLHHIIMQVLKPAIGRPMYEHSYASLPKKGCQAGKRTIEKWIKHDYKGTKYYLKMDIRKFFDNIDHDILRAKLRHYIKDEKFMGFIDPTISIPLDDGTYTKKGLPLGFYTSQWYSNFYLTEFDHWVTETLTARHYIRYMDDLVIFGSNRRKLKHKEAEIEKWLWDNLHLEIKPNWRIVKLGNEDGEDLDFMGYRFYRNRTTVRRKVLYNTTRKARRLHKKTRPNVREAKQMLSQIGRWKRTDTYGVYDMYVAPYITIRQLKHIVRYSDKRDAEHEKLKARRIKDKCGQNHNQWGLDPLHLTPIYQEDLYM